MTAGRPPRFKALYYYRVARTARGRQRHLFKAAGSGFTSVCGDALWTVALSDEMRAPRCSECRLLAVTELSLALEMLGLTDLAVAVAGAANELSFETGAAMAG